jgi:DNA invertase Pin-like site-specific DNA recombinase
MRIGYARVSTRDQAAGRDAQRRDLAAMGCDKIIVEEVSSVAERPLLEALFVVIGQGDQLVVTRLDRFARSVTDLWALLARLDQAGASLKVLSFDGGSLDTATAQGRLIVTVLGAVAQFEREIMLERQREGIAKAKAEGKYKGRKPTARAQAGEIRRLRTVGLTHADIAGQLGISERSVYRVLAAPA